MKQFKDVLFVSQGLTDDQDSLGQSILLTANHQASLRGLIVCPSLPDHMGNYVETYEQSLRQSLKQNVLETIEQHQLPDYSEDFPIVLKSGDKPAVKIIRHVQEHGIDLVMKDAEPIGEHGEGFKAIDMALLRQCPVPVWLNRPTNKPMTKRRVAVAIDANVTDEEQKQLTTKLLQTARAIADGCDSRLHIVSCWEYQLEHYLDNQSWIKMPRDELDENREQARVKHNSALKWLVQESGIDGENIIHQLHGRADDEIPRCAVDLDIDVLVMGTIARTGIPGVLIGNTAENILQSVSCSLVALKPKTFVSPIG
ncbi:universal stress protein [Vibrio sp. 10N.261.55.A7]|uniref:universal stress protein n=1 Tax=Vibrio sp. 10N.261.55.A7 TaxID=1880851 RepID=UPI000C83CEF0|nr:universal stress protein [Vibrio sp. 10N.261.55.A7]PMJ91682.1 universal stress protein [Vibrio sp. 10N.261.55.A7]